MKRKIIHGIAALAAALAWAAGVIVLSAPATPAVRFTPLSGETFSTSDLDEPNWSEVHHLVERALAS